jgi:hypothetical protein
MSDKTKPTPEDKPVLDLQGEGETSEVDAHMGGNCISVLSVTEAV